MHTWHEINRQISAATNSNFKIKETNTIGGGCINQAYFVADGAQRYFVKLNTTDCLAMFEAEAAGLMEIHQSHTLRVPLPVCYGQNDHHAAVKGRVSYLKRICPDQSIVVHPILAISR